jgi:hypothetical protein
MWCRVGLVRADVWKENILSIFRVKRISELGIILAVTSKMKAILSSKTLALS